MRSLLIGLAAILCLVACTPSPTIAAGPAQSSPPESAQPGNNAALWREVRSGTPQTTQARGVEAGVLVQPSGQTWRMLRPVIAVAGSALLVLCAAAIGLFYWWRGPIGVSEPPTGRRIERFDLADRITHWVMGLSFVALAISGLTLSFGKYLLLPVIGYTLFSIVASIMKGLHNFIGPVFMFSLPVFILLYIRDNLPKMHDFAWLMKGGGMFTREHVPSGRFNAGEKTLFWGLVCFFCVILCVSGLVLDFPNFGQGRFTMQAANVIHWCVGLLAIAASLFHIYLGTIGMEGAYRAMRSGYVDETWAREHHELWYRDVVAGRSKQHLVAPDTPSPTSL